MAKIQNDKYYTSPELAKYCVEKTKEIIGEDNITEYIEPSAGSGVFLNYLDKPYLAYVIEPEDERIVKADWLEISLDYKKGRCVIGNPPFGEGTRISNRFAKKAFKIADYLSFILPICQLNNREELYEFDLIHSEDLGLRLYSGREVHCCLNIYCRPSDGKLHKKEKQFNLKDITMKEVRKSRKQYLPKDFNYDIGICKWGSVGKIIEKGKEGTYHQELYIRCNNDNLKEKVVETIKDIDWEDFVISSKSPTISQWMIRKYLKDHIPELE